MKKLFTFLGLYKPKKQTEVVKLNTTEPEDKLPFIAWIHGIRAGDKRNTKIMVGSNATYEPYPYFEGKEGFEKMMEYHHKQQNLIKSQQIKQNHIYNG